MKIVKFILWVFSISKNSLMWLHTVFSIWCLLATKWRLKGELDRLVLSWQFKVLILAFAQEEMFFRDLAAL